MNCPSFTASCGEDEAVVTFRSLIICAAVFVAAAASNRRCSSGSRATAPFADLFADPFPETFTNRRRSNMEATSPFSRGGKKTRGGNVATRAGRGQWIRGERLRNCGYFRQNARRAWPGSPAVHRADGLFVDADARAGGVLPAHSGDFEAAVLAEGAGEGRVMQDGDDLVGHLVHVPEVYLQRVGEDFADAGLF